MLVVAFIAGLWWIIWSSAQAGRAQLSYESSHISLALTSLPYYVLRSVIRMVLAFLLSLAFTFVYGYIAAHNRVAEMVLIPLLDILQSVPVLGFLSVSVASLVSLFPGSILGYEIASILAIFTSQAWNMTFAFYQSLTSIPRDLREAASMLRLSKWQTFKYLELPYSIISLVWNGMMSFGGGWFFLAASETITVLGRDVQLPGIGSYMATAIRASSTSGLLAALVSMVAVIVVIDQIVWRPLVVWSRKFKVEMTASDEEPTSWVMELVKKSLLLSFLEDAFRPIGRFMAGYAERLRRGRRKGGRALRLISRVALICMDILIVGLLVRGAFWFVRGIWLLWSVLDIGDVLKVFYLGGLTLVRVMAAVFLGMLWTIPAGVKIGTNPRLRRFLQPVVQVLASFPANMLFPFVTVLYIRYHISMEIGSIPLMMLGTQWYLLFNVIGGAMSIPNDLNEASVVYGLRGIQRWTKFILPAIFPSVVTGGITAAGGAWNASIVAEVTSWGSTTLTATGLGSLISQATNSGDWAMIVLSISAMAAIVVGVNRLFWRRLYARAEEMRAM
ncbi:MAG TPA: ABC transporter permease subunit [Firmicutes bacterium]|nr:ABC transporter permease subunit [Candidatus Fermentithermobacillaceae bacterium]